MKKILLASTALIASAGMAAAQAEVVVGGDGYFGIMYGEDLYNSVATDDGIADYSFAYDLDIDVTVSGTSDSGLTFGAKIDVDDAAGAQGGTDSPGSEGSIFISGDFGTLSMGDIDGAAEVVVGDLAGVGLTGLFDANETVFLQGIDGDDFEGVLFDADFGGDADLIARYDYSIQGIALSLSLNDEQGYGVGVGYSTDLFAVGVGYESQELGEAITGGASATVSHIIGSASVTFSGVTVKALYGQFDGDNVIGDFDQYGASVGGDFGAASVAAYFKRFEFDAFDGAEAADDDVYGVGGAYDLGGGLSLKAGIAQFEPEVGDSTTVADFGVAINF